MNLEISFEKRKKIMFFLLKTKTFKKKNIPKKGYCFQDKMHRVYTIFFS